MEKKELLMYEVPTLGEFVINSYLQGLIGKYTAWKINRKWKRYQFRLARDRFFSNK